MVQFFVGLQTLLRPITPVLVQVPPRIQRVPGTVPREADVTQSLMGPITSSHEVKQAVTVILAWCLISIGTIVPLSFYN